MAPGENEFDTPVLEERNCVLFTFKYLELGPWSSASLIVCIQGRNPAKKQLDFTYKDETDEIR